MDILIPATVEVEHTTIGVRARIIINNDTTIVPVEVAFCSAATEELALWGVLGIIKGTWRRPSV